MVNQETRRILKKTGFRHIADVKTESYWITPISGRILIITDSPIYEPLDERFRFGGIRIPSGGSSFVISNLIAKFDPSEHQLIDSILDND